MPVSNAVTETEVWVSGADMEAHFSQPALLKDSSVKNNDHFSHSLNQLAVYHPLYSTPYGVPQIYTSSPACSASVLSPTV